jgi:hypothetical protein
VDGRRLQLLVHVAREVEVGGLSGGEEREVLRVAEVLAERVVVERARSLVGGDRLVDLRGRGDLLVIARAVGERAPAAEDRREVRERALERLQLLEQPRRALDLIAHGLGRAVVVGLDGVDALAGRDLDAVLGLDRRDDPGGLGLLLGVGATCRSWLRFP